MRVRRGIHTADELLRLPDGGRRFELIEGRLYSMAPTGDVHGFVESNIDNLLAPFVRERGLGWVLVGEPGFWLGRDPDTVRAPDVAFVSHARLGRHPSGGFPRIAPDLAVEILSPGDRPGRVQGKVDEWLASGSLAVWLVDPIARTVTIHEPGRVSRRLGEEDELTGEPALPGFRCRVAAFFEGL